ncbi:5-methylaminomethyl-2-thiouridine methyltransferase [Shinella sumterensis]|uniref:tRNA (5-methylaminomethyl-2-thiouridine)(34)-methyltransferase MnmD n=1 Tax=Shinella sumterensis TaxID=1967501 RepID=UPI00106E114E|nr:tRNA (5-methylaminomethyl-2-thiouridine)(34)-methyltransferase MnmD [Shinella sumterensis]MCD1263248.1 tRNA (5-methylaminomethyl-2-thiouridine)(34)-methyltransferase MnmD [Shinella sumterensis]TFE99644.1 5-methylaminomethyl-2-thiouridine methyltransferase [Shinella sumterensis]
MADHDPENTTVETALDWHEGDMPYSRAFDDHFYCRSDGRLECGHVFLDGNDLPRRWQRDGTFRIGELGFGTGLNLCETWRQWRESAPEGASLHFTSFELFPMARADIDRALAHWPEIDRERSLLAEKWPDAPTGRVEIALEPRVRLTVVCGAALDSLNDEKEPFDAWYLDGFAPSRNPDMWSPELMQAVFRLTAAGGRFATYAAAGFVRRNLAAAGFTVERRPGFAGKREMLCGEKPVS